MKCLVLLVSAIALASSLNPADAHATGAKAASRSTGDRICAAGSIVDLSVGGWDELSLYINNKWWKVRRTSGVTNPESRALLEIAKVAIILGKEVTIYDNKGGNCMYWDEILISSDN